jgi:GrpB-like predicted nucleotidyltransferase (UPF0157 family)
MERYGGGSIVVSDYDPAWPRMFEAERRRLEATLGSLLLAIEHVGSTAVPGLPAKPIIDLQASVQRLAEAKAEAVEPLERLGYSYLPHYESWLPGQLFFRKSADGHWTHHLHLLPQDSPRWRDRLLFRDYLRRHTEAARDYAKLKRDLAAAFADDIAGYRDAKDAFVAATMAAARAAG